jgi:hypothetical protein
LSSLQAAARLLDTLPVSNSQQNGVRTVGVIASATRMSILDKNINISHTFEIENNIFAETNSAAKGIR